jgi:2-dehydro-3-deoxyglucarate aldolase/4-hydroxy-2-oxoheptanedioate aldolase
VKYVPMGKRGVALGIAHDGYTGGAVLDKLAAANARTCIFEQIETREGVADADAIAGTDGIDCLWVGHFDLTNFMGIPAAFDHPDYLAAIDRCVAAARRNDKPAGFMALDAKWAADYWKLGFDIIAYGLDHLLYQGALGEGMKLLDGLRREGRAG